MESEKFVSLKNSLSLNDQLLNWFHNGPCLLRQIEIIFSHVYDVTGSRVIAFLSYISNYLV